MYRAGLSSILKCDCIILDAFTWFITSGVTSRECRGMMLASSSTSEICDLGFVMKSSSLSFNEISKLTTLVCTANMKTGAKHDTIHAWDRCWRHDNTRHFIKVAIYSIHFTANVANWRQQTAFREKWWWASATPAALTDSAAYFTDKLKISWVWSDWIVKYNT